MPGVGSVAVDSETSVATIGVGSGIEWETRSSIRDLLRQVGFNVVFTAHVEDESANAGFDDILDAAETVGNGEQAS